MAGDNHIYEDVKVKNRCWNAYFTGCLRELYMKTELCDTILVAGAQSSQQGKTLLESELLYNKSLFPAHKCVVGAVSPFLRNMFKDIPHGYEFNIPIVTGDALRHILNFIYSGESDVPPDHIDDLFCAAVVLQIESLSFQIKKAITKPASHWETLRGTTLSTLHPNEPRGRRKRKKSEERENSLVDSEPSEHNSSGRSSEGKKDVGNELLQHLIMDAKEEPPSPPSQPNHVPEVQQPVFPCSQPVFPGQDEPQDMMYLDKSSEPDTSISPNPNSAATEDRYDKTRNELCKRILMDTKKERHSPSPPPSTCLPDPIEQPVFPCSQPVFPGQEEPPETIKQHVNPDRNRSPKQDGIETVPDGNNGIKAEKSWPEHQPIVIEPSMAFNLYEMAQRHHGPPEDEAPTTDRYGFSPNATQKDSQSASNGADAGPSASSVLRSLLKRKERSVPPASVASPPQTSASSTLRAMLRQRPLVPASAWPASQVPNWPKPPPVSTQRLKALLDTPNTVFNDGMNGGGGSLEREGRKRGATSHPNDTLDVVKRKRTSSPPPRSMPAALKPIGALTEMRVRSEAKQPEKEATKSSSARVTRSQSSEKRRSKGGAEDNGRAPSPMHPILFSILKEPNMRVKTEEGTDAEEEDEEWKPDKPSSAKDSPRSLVGVVGGVGHQPLFTPREERELCAMIAVRLSRGESAERSDILRLAHDYAVQLGKRDRAHPLSRKWYYGFIKRMRLNEGCAPDGGGVGGFPGAGSGGGRGASGGIVEALVESAIQDFERNAVAVKPESRMGGEEGSINETY